MKWLLFYILFVVMPVAMLSQYSGKEKPSLSKDEINKLDPRFQAVIAREYPQLGIKTGAPHVEPVAVLEDSTRIYGAIIYTTEPDSLRTAGIQINSVLPKFVTARVTVMDLVKLAKLDVVKHIDAGERLYPSKKKGVQR